MLKRLYEKYGRKKLYFASAILLIIINILVIDISHQVKISFSVEGIGFKYISQSENYVLFQDAKGSNVTITKDNWAMQEPLSIAGRYEIEYKDKVIKCDSTEWMKKGEVITLSDGSQYVRQPFTVVVNGQREDISSLPFDVQLVRRINDAYANVKKGSPFWALLYAIPLIFLGLANLFYPEKIWRFKHLLDVSGGEPTDFAIFCNRAAGVLFIGFAILSPIFF